MYNILRKVYIRGLKKRWGQNNISIEDFVNNLWSAFNRCWSGFVFMKMFNIQMSISH